VAGGGGVPSGAGAGGITTGGCGSVVVEVPGVGAVPGAGGATAPGMGVLDAPSDPSVVVAPIETAGPAGGGGSCGITTAGGAGAGRESCSDGAASPASGAVRSSSAPGHAESIDTTPASPIVKAVRAERAVMCFPPLIRQPAR
jgi:hypothetical protein